MFPNYSIAGDTATGAVGLSKLHQELLGAYPANFVGLQTSDDALVVTYGIEPDAPTKAAIDALIGAHDGGVVYTPVFRVAVMAVVQAINITETEFGEASEVGGSVTTPSFFLANPGEFWRLIGQTTGKIQTNGTVELRMMENGSPLSAAYQHGDTSNQWENFEFQSNTPPTEGMHEYALEARLVGATSAKVRRTAMSIMELT
jgi:hypothetical protein